MSHVNNSSVEFGTEEIQEQKKVEETTLADELQAVTDGGATLNEFETKTENEPTSMTGDAEHDSEVDEKSEGLVLTDMRNESAAYGEGAHVEESDDREGKDESSTGSTSTTGSKDEEFSLGAAYQESMSRAAIELKRLAEDVRSNISVELLEQFKALNPFNPIDTEWAKLAGKSMEEAAKSDLEMNEPVVKKTEEVSVCPRCDHQRNINGDQTSVEESAGLENEEPSAEDTDEDGDDETTEAGDN